MRRREFIAMLGGAAVAWPLVALAQQPAMPVIGFLHIASPEPLSHILLGFRQGLSETGYVEGQNVAIDYRWARGQYDLLPALAAELVKQRVAVIVAGGGEMTAAAVKAATSTIPTIFTSAGDPTKVGLVESLNRPGGNLTGIVTFTSVVETKKLGLLRELISPSTVIAMLINPEFPTAEADAKEVEAAARTLGHTVLVLRASTDQELEVAFATMVEGRLGALLVAGAPFFNARRERLVTLANQHALPAIYEYREYVTAGGLMSYGISLPDNYRQMGIYVGQVLKGTKPAELPILQPTKFILVVNLKTANALGLTVPPGVLAIADEVIE